MSRMSLQLDAESSRWLDALRGDAASRTPALARLHTMMLGVARAEGYRRRGSLSADVAADLDDLCLQAANDAVLAILKKLDEFRGESRFTTWAYRFAILEISVRLRRRAWSARQVDLDEVSWGRLADPSPAADSGVEQQEFVHAVRNAVRTTLTRHQRRVFLAVVAEEIPIDVVADRMNSTRGAVYKVLHDARRKLRDALTAAGHLETE